MASRVVGHRRPAARSGSQQRRRFRPPATVELEGVLENGAGIASKHDDLTACRIERDRGIGTCGRITEQQTGPARHLGPTRAIAAVVLDRVAVIAQLALDRIERSVATRLVGQAVTRATIPGGLVTVV